MSRNQILCVATLFGLAVGGPLVNAAQADPANPALKAFASEKHIGVFKATLQNGYRILKLRADGTLLYVNVQKGMATCTRGEYKLDGGNYSFTVAGKKWDDGQIRWIGSDLLHLRKIGTDGKVSPGMIYRRQSDTKKDSLPQAGTWTAKLAGNVSVVVQINADKSFTLVRMTGNAQNFASGTWKISGGFLVLTTETETLPFEIEALQSGTLYLRSTKAPANDPGVFLTKQIG